MKINDEVFVHGYVDEIRNDIVIIRNKGGFFGTDPYEVWKDGAIVFPKDETKAEVREKALLLLLDWAIESGFGYDQFEDEYERYKDDVEYMDYDDGMIYIAEQVVKEGRA